MQTKRNTMNSVIPNGPAISLGKFLRELSAHLWSRNWAAAKHSVSLQVLLLTLRSNLYGTSGTLKKVVLARSLPSNTSLSLVSATSHDTRSSYPSVTGQTCEMIFRVVYHQMKNGLQYSQGYVDITATTHRRAYEAARFRVPKDAVIVSTERLEGNNNAK